MNCTEKCRYVRMLMVKEMLREKKGKCNENNLTQPQQGVKETFCTYDAFSK